LGTEFDKGMSVQASGSITQLPAPQQAALLPMVKRGSPVTMRKAREAIFVFPDRPLSVLQQRLFNSCVYFAQRQPELHSWKVLISELEHVIGYKDSSNRRYVMGELLSLMKEHVVWDATTNPLDRKISASTLLADVTHLVDQKAFEFSFSPKLREALLDPKIWQRINLLISQRFRSMGSGPLYEWCKRYERTGMTSRWSWEDFRHAVVGIIDSDSIYAHFKHFRAKVLNRAIAEVNELTDIEVTLILHKVGRVVNQIQFKVDRKGGDLALEADSQNPPQVSSSTTALLEEVLKLGVSPNKAAQLMSEFSEEQVRAALQHTLLRDASKDKEPLKSRASFFVSSIENGYSRSGVSGKLNAGTSPRRPVLNDADLRESFMCSRDAKAEKAFLEMPLDEQAEVLQRYNSSVRNDKLLYDPSRSTKLAKTGFIRFLNQHLWGEPGDADLYAYHFKN
jgi:hypothetical protein